MAPSRFLIPMLQENGGNVVMGSRIFLHPNIVFLFLLVIDKYNFYPAKFSILAREIRHNMVNLHLSFIYVFFIL